jgi:hypothetical protein
MPFQFLSTRLTFDPTARNVHLAAIADDDIVEVIVSHLVVEHLARATDLTKDDAITTVVRHKKELEAATVHALNSHDAARRVVVVRMPDLNAVTGGPEKHAAP